MAKQTCPVCKGSGEIDTVIHLVQVGQKETLCGSDRPVTRRRRTTDHKKATCAECLRLHLASIARGKTAA